MRDRKDIDAFDALFRSKLKDFEEKPSLDDWSAVEHRLSKGKLLPFYKTSVFYRVAAVVAFLMCLSVFFVLERERPNQMVEVVPKILDDRLLLKDVEPSIEEPLAKVRIVRAQMPNTADKGLSRLAVNKKKAVQASSLQKVNKEASSKAETPKTEDSKEKDFVLQKGNLAPIHKTVRYTTKHRKAKRGDTWKIGIGGGSTSTSSALTERTSLASDPIMNVQKVGLMYTSRIQDPTVSERENIHHHRPLSIGLSVSRRFTQRWRFESGIVYSFLLSEWDLKDSPETVEQRLHFIGLPLALSYKMAEWDRFICYTSVGGRIDFNINGKQTYRLAEAQEEREASFSIDSRMKKVLFSFNGKLGLSYPIGKVFSLYSEMGIAYYLKNNSEVETYYLKHPFMLDFNIGLRIGL